ncbi:replication initiator [Streptomyces sp. NPDC051776]|uniref:replication initiator n=1 Tax=Streptomyces sp. NPDC051776 TaxID=3155414 RepID=UPI00343857A2
MTQTHSISAPLANLIDLAAMHDFDRLQAQIERLGGCARPIQITGFSATINKETSEVLHVFNTDDEPTGRLLVACGNRRTSRCPTCAETYRRDTFHLIATGLSGGKGTPKSIATHPRAFVTLTAPSFGPVHHKISTRSGVLKPCRCGHTHAAGDPLIGSPLNLDTYDYESAVLWNAHAAKIWARFTTRLRREVAKAAGLSQREFRDHARLSYAKVAEYQARGAVHFHAVVRIDGPEGSSDSPPAWATSKLLTKATKAAIKSTAVPGLGIDGNRHLYAFGKVFNVQPIRTHDFDGDTPFTDQTVAAYIAKYATKGAEAATDAIDHPLYCPTCQGTGYSDRYRCTRCDGTGEGQPIAHLVVADHARNLFRACFNLGGRPEYGHLLLRKWAHMVGFPGHFSTKSRRYSTTLGALRDVRRAWRTHQSRAALGLLDDTTLVLESAWTFIGTGYSPGEELLAAQVRRENVVARDHKNCARTEEVWL